MLRLPRPSLTLRPWLVVLSVTGATILPSYLNGALTVALPSIGAQIGLSAAEWSWPLTVLSLVNGAFLLISGGLADAFGRRWVFLLGLAWLMVFSLALAFIRQSTPFIAMSAVLGFGAALLAPAGTGIIGESLPEGKFKNGAFAALGAGQPVGFIVGLLFGGVFGQSFYVLYIVNAGAAGVFVLMAWTCLPADGERLVIVTRGATSREDLAILTGREADEDGTPRRRAPLMAFDWFGALLITTSLVLITLGIAFAGTEKRGWASVPVLSMVPVGASTMLSFFLWELHVQRQSVVVATDDARAPPRAATLRAPLIPPGIWSAPNFSALMATIFFSWLAFNTLTYYCTLYFQEIQELKPITTSVRFLPMIGVGLSLNILGGFLLDKVSVIYMIMLGLTGSLGSSLIYIFMEPGWGYEKGMLWVMCLIVSTDIFYPAAQLFACHTVGPRRAALAGSLFNVTTRLATSIGLAATTSITTVVTERYARTHTLTTPAAYKQATLAGYRAAGWFCVACTVLALIVAPLTVRNVGVVGKIAGGGTRQRVPTTSQRRSPSRSRMTSQQASRRTSIDDASIALQPLAHNGTPPMAAADELPLAVESITPVAHAHMRTLRADEAFLGGTATPPRSKMDD